MNFTDMTDDELDRAVAEAIEPEPWRACVHSFDGLLTMSEYGCWSSDSARMASSDPKDWLWDAARHFRDETADWGWLMLRERISVEPSKEGWAASHKDAKGPSDWRWDMKIGRVICIAFLEARK